MHLHFQTENLVIKYAVGGAFSKLLLSWNPEEVWEHGKISLLLWINISQTSPERISLKISRQLSLLLLLFSLARLVWDWERRWQFSEINPDLRLPIHSAVLGSHLLQAHALHTWSLPFIFLSLQRSFHKFPFNQPFGWVGTDEHHWGEGTVSCVCKFCHDSFVAYYHVWILDYC